MALDEGLCSPVSHADILWEKNVSLRIISTMLRGLTREAACEDIPVWQPSLRYVDVHLTASQTRRGSWTPSFESCQRRSQRPTSRSSLTGYANGVWNNASDTTTRMDGRGFWQAAQTLLGNLGPRSKMTTLVAAVREKGYACCGSWLTILECMQTYQWLEDFLF